MRRNFLLSALELGLYAEDSVAAILKIRDDGGIETGFDVRQKLRWKEDESKVYGYRRMVLLICLKKKLKVPGYINNLKNASQSQCLESCLCPEYLLHRGSARVTECGGNVLSRYCLTRLNFLLTVVTPSPLVEGASMHPTSPCLTDPAGVTTTANGGRVIVKMGEGGRFCEVNIASGGRAFGLRCAVDAVLLLRWIELSDSRLVGHGDFVLMFRWKLSPRRQV